MRPAIASGIVTGYAPVSYWPIFSRPQKQSQRSFRSSFLLIVLSGECRMKLRLLRAKNLRPVQKKTQEQ